MKCHCGPYGLSCAFACRAKAARTEAAKIILIDCRPWLAPRHQQNYAPTPAYMPAAKLRTAAAAPADWRRWRRCAGPIAHCPPQQRGELGDVRRESMPSSLCALANKFEHLTSFELFVFTFRERQIPRIAGSAIDAAHDADVTGGCTFHAE